MAVVDVVATPELSWKYGKRRCCGNLTSQYIASVPSLHLTDEVYDYPDVDQNANVLGTSTKNSIDVDTNEHRHLSYDEHPIDYTDVPEIFRFPDVDVMLFSDEECLYDDVLHFQKCRNNIPYEGYSKLTIRSRCPAPIAFKVMCNKPEETKAIPNIGVVYYDTDQRLTIFLKRWTKEHMSQLIFKIKIVPLDEGFDVTNVWHNPEACIRSTQRLQCMLVDDGISSQYLRQQAQEAEDGEYADDEGAEQDEEAEEYDEGEEDEEAAEEDVYEEVEEEEDQDQEGMTKVKFMPRPTFVPEKVDGKRRRKGFVRRFFRRFAKMWRRLRGKSAKKVQFDQQVHN